VDMKFLTVLKSHRLEFTSPLMQTLMKSI